VGAWDLERKERKERKEGKTGENHDKYLCTCLSPRAHDLPASRPANHLVVLVLGLAPPVDAVVVVVGIEEEDQDVGQH